MLRDETQIVGRRFDLVRPTGNAEHKYFAFLQDNFDVLRVSCPILAHDEVGFVDVEPPFLVMLNSPCEVGLDSCFTVPDLEGREFLPPVADGFLWRPTKD